MTEFNARHRGVEKIENKISGQIIEVTNEVHSNFGGRQSSRRS